jgi:hypothetical protein
VALQTAVQRGSRQVRDRRLQGVEAIVQQQQCMPTESDDASVLANPPDWLRVFALVLDAQHR